MGNINHLENYIRVKHSLKKIELEVCSVKWEGSHTPVFKWKVVKILEPNSQDHEIDLAVNNLLRDPEFFLKCTLCSDIQLVGNMFDESTCQTCASAKYGVVY